MLPGFRARRDAATVRNITDAAPAPHVRPGVPAGTARSRPRDEHRDQLRDHDDLAGLRRRDHDELSEPGLGPHVPELPRRGRRPRHRHRVHPGPGPAAHPSARQLLGGRDPRDSLGAAAPRAGDRPVARMAGGAHELLPVRACRGPAANRLRRAGDRPRGQARPRREGAAEDEEDAAHRAGHRAGPRRRPRAHQESRHQWRRLLQRQRGTPVRESDSPREPSRAAVHRGPAGLAHLHLRAHDRPARSGLGAVRGDGRALRGGPPGLPSGRAARPLPRRPGGGSRGRCFPGRRQHGGQGGPLRNRRLGPGRGYHVERRDRVIQLDARQLHSPAAW